MKIVILGQFSAGKSTLVRQLCKGSSISIDKFGTTVSLDHGLTIMYGITINVFGTPGLERFEILRKILSEGADGIIFVVDSINPIESEEARDLYIKLNEQLPYTPVVIAANKQDLEEAMPPSEVLSAIKLSESDNLIATLPISAKTGEGVDKILSILILSVISKNMDILCAVREGGNKGIKGIRKALKETKEDKDVHDLVQWLSWRGLISGNWEDQQFKLPKRIEEIIEIFEFVRMENVSRTN
ncbi:MAG: GTP-binding protein [Candidatus Hodarchaeales archaeon]